MGKHSIEVNFKQAKERAAELEATAALLLKLQRENLEELNSLSGKGWKGEAADIYRNKLLQLSQSVKAQSDRLNKLGTDIRTIAKRIYDAELAAYYAAHSHH